MAKLQKEVDRLEGKQIVVFSFFELYYFSDELLAEKEKYKGVSEELDMTLNELSGY